MNPSATRMILRAKGVNGGKGHFSMLGTGGIRSEVLGPPAADSLEIRIANGLGGTGKVCKARAGSCHVPVSSLGCSSRTFPILAVRPSVARALHEACAEAASRAGIKTQRLRSLLESFSTDCRLSSRS